MNPLTPKNSPQGWETILQHWNQYYLSEVPMVAQIAEAMRSAGIIQHFQEIQNDHIALRTFHTPELGIEAWEPIFLHYGYQKRDRYVFPAKKLTAYWYQHENSIYPRIFLSELNIDQLSAESAQIITSYTQNAQDVLRQIEISDPECLKHCLLQRPWQIPQWQDYQILRSESEFASWLLVHGWKINHYTISVQHLPKPYCSLAQFNKWLRSNDFCLNDAQGEIKISADTLLLQSSTVAAWKEMEFVDDTEQVIRHSIPSAYVEFAERKILPQYQHLTEKEQKKEHYRDGFDTGNADGIFESTDQAQAERVLA